MASDFPFTSICKERGLSAEEILFVEKAYHFAENAHKDHRRFSGEPYFMHLVATARALLEFDADVPTIAAGLLHDSIEDAGISPETIRDIFGAEVLFLVEGVTKLGKLHYHGLKRHAESLRKLFMAMAEDPRVIIIRLADRLHNMKTLDHVPEVEKRRRIALETLEIYTPIAHRLGMGRIKGELEDLAFRYVDSEMFSHVDRLLRERSRPQKERLEKIERTLRKKLAPLHIPIIALDYRVKHRWSLYRKLQKHHMNIEEIYDLAALRMIVPSIEECYRVLGVIHSIWKPVPGRIKDYIASPKPNGYRSLHTTIFTGDNAIIEIQLRTPEMHREAEFGIAAHARYKEGGWKDRATAWLKEFAETHNAAENPRAFIKNVRSDLFTERIFTLTPRGEAIDLPNGATPVDFAYAIHSDIGHRMAGAKVNGKLIALDTKLKSGDIVEIITKKAGKPSEKWLDFAFTSEARRKIKSALHKRNSRTL